MKNLIIIAVIFLMFSCLNSPEDKAKNSIHQYLKENLNNPASYESIRYGELTKNYTHPESISERDNGAQIQRSGYEMVDMRNNRDVYEKRMRNGYYDTMQRKFRKWEDSLYKGFKPRFIGYYLDHTYRADNAMGTLTLHSTRFTLDTNLKVVAIGEN